MNRTIKFRGKRIDDGSWVYGNLFNWYRRTAVIPIIGDGVRNGSVIGNEVDPETVGEFTGLLDKNGKEIYEEDIIESKYSNPAPVEFIEGQFCANYNGCCALIPSEAYVVIGNIHDNPERLNTNKADEK